LFIVQTLVDASLKWQDAMQLAMGAAAELGEDLGQVVLDGAR
jgi:hypothetical protein